MVHSSTLDDITASATIANATTAFADDDNKDQSRRRLSTLIRHAREEKFQKKHSFHGISSERRIKWQVGDKITVVKQGSQLGKKGVVEKPAWMGRVRVKMDQTGAIKSYLCEEIRKEYIIEKMQTVFLKLAVAFVPKKTPKRNLDPAAIFTRASPETRALAKRVTDHAKQQEQAERIGNSVLETQDLVNARSNTYLLLCVIACLGTFMCMLEVEILTKNNNEPTDTTDTLKWMVTCTTALTIWLLFVYYQDELTLGKAKQKYESVETLFSTFLAYPMLFEMFLMCLHPMPLVHGEFEIKLAHLEDPHIYTWDSVFSIFVLLRLYLLYRAMHYFLGDETSPDARMLATLNHVPMGPFFTFKHLMHTHPFTVIGTLACLLWIVFSYAIRIAERPNNVDFEHYFSSLWCIAITMTTVGYGDMTPESHAGRMVAVASVAFGTCLVALLVAAVHQSMQFTNNEEVTKWALYKSRLTVKVHNKAARVIQALMRVGICKGFVTAAKRKCHVRKSQKWRLATNAVKTTNMLTALARSASGKRVVVGAVESQDSPVRAAQHQPQAGADSKKITPDAFVHPSKKENTIANHELQTAMRNDFRATVSLMREVRSWHDLLLTFKAARMNEPGLAGASGTNATKQALFQEKLQKILTSLTSPLKNVAVEQDRRQNEVEASQTEVIRYLQAAEAKTELWQQRIEKKLDQLQKKEESKEVLQKIMDTKLEELVELVQQQQVAYEIREGKL